MFKLILSFLINIWYNTYIIMARPRTVKYGSGVVILKDLTQEEKDTVEKLLFPEAKGVVADTPVVEEVTPTAPLSHKAFSITKVGNMWSLVTIEFNPETLETSKCEIKPLHTNKNIAMSQFAVAQMKFLPR